MMTRPGAMERSHDSPPDATGERGVRRRSSGRVTVREEERPSRRASRSQPGAGYDAGMRLASRMDTIGTETAFEAAARARALEAQGGT